MTPADAHRYATRYKNIWRGGPAHDELIAQFTVMEHTAAGAALTHLARDNEHPPTIAALWTEYRARRPVADTASPVDTGPPVALDDVIARLEQKINNGSGSDNDLADLNRWRRLRAESVARHPTTARYEPATLDGDA